MPAPANLIAQAPTPEATALAERLTRALAVSATEYDREVKAS